jgi:plasmid stability protein
MSLKPPKELKARLAAAAAPHGYASAEELFETLLERGLAADAQQGDPAELGARVTVVAARRGYASPGEMIEHLLEQGLAPLEGPGDEEAVAARLRGLGYIE